MKLADQYSDASAEQAESLGSGARATELIVHGVGGAPPDDLLDDFHPTRVSGDRHAGFYRPQLPPPRATGDGAALDPERYPREAFAWGGLTSGDAARSLWFLLLPYALMNLAGWMLPRVKRRSWLATRGLARVLAALGTLTMVVASAQLSLDLLAYQCGWLNSSCRDRWWLRFLFGDLWNRYPSRVMVLATVIPLLILFGVWAAGLLSFRNFEEYVRTRGSAPPGGGDQDLGLEHPWFWRGKDPVHRMRRLHFQLGVMALAVVLAVSLAELTAAAWPWQAQVVVWGGGVAMLVVLAAIASPRVEVGDTTGLIDSDAFRRGCWLVAWVLLALAVGYGIGGVGAVNRGPGYPRLEGFIPVSTVLTATQLGLGVVLGAWVWLKGKGGSFLRVAPFIVHALGWFMIMSLWAGLGIRLAGWLGVNQADAARFWLTQPSTCTTGTFCYPIWFEDAAVAVTMLLFALLLVGGVFLLRRSGEGDLARVRSDYPAGDEDVCDWEGADRRRLLSVAKRLRHQRLVRAADEWLAAIVLATLVAFVVIAYFQADGWRFWSWLVTLSGWVVALVPVVTVIAVRTGLNDPKARRAIGAVFDVVTFFPRRVHPFAPPCYGERAVPQLRWRLGWATTDDTDKANPAPTHVLARSHSQGTVVTAAAALQGVDNPERVWLLTCGSPLVALYERHFPHYFHDITDRVGTALALAPGDTTPRWLHVTASTDVLGTLLRCDGGFPPKQIRVRDPVQWSSMRPGDPPPESLGHSCYHRHPVVEAWVVHQLRLATGLPSSDPTGAVALDPC